MLYHYELTLTCTPNGGCAWMVEEIQTDDLYGENRVWLEGGNSATLEIGLALATAALLVARAGANQ